MNPFKLTPSKIYQSVDSNISINVEFAMINISNELELGTIRDYDLGDNINAYVIKLKNAIAKEIIKQCHIEYNKKKGF